MKPLIPSLLTLLLCVPCTHAAKDAEQWYVEDYASLWQGSPGDNIEAMLTHYASEVVTHEADGRITVSPKRDWLVAPMKAWLAEGWTESELKTVATDRINASTASFKATWIDRYSNAPEDVSCGWYLADLIDGRWQFTAYADLDCAVHDLE